MNLPNKLTMLRIFLIPVFLVFFLVEGIPGHYLWALFVFLLASFTDLLDGKIARSRGLVTDFGKLMDPLADKLLVMAAMVSLMKTGLAPGLVVIVILAREFMVTSLRLIAAGQGAVLAADIWGKCKTVSQMVWLSYDLLLLSVGTLPGLSDMAAVMLGALHYMLLGIVVVLTVVSGVNYMVKNRKVFWESK